MALANVTSSSSVSTCDWRDVDFGNDQDSPKFQQFFGFDQWSWGSYIRPKWDFYFFGLWHTSARLPRKTTSKVPEAWLSDPVLRTTLLCWILKGDKGWKRRKNSGDGKGPRGRAVEQSWHNVKLQAQAEKASRVFCDHSMTLYNVSWILDKNLLAIDGNWIVDSSVEEIPSLLVVQHSMFRCWPEKLIHETPESHDA